MSAKRPPHTHKKETKKMMMMMMMKKRFNLHRNFVRCSVLINPIKL